MTNQDVNLDFIEIKHIADQVTRHQAGDTATATALSLGLQLVDQVDGIEEARLAADAADAAGMPPPMRLAAWGPQGVALASSSAADQRDITLVIEEGAAGSRSAASEWTEYLSRSNRAGQVFDTDADTAWKPSNRPRYGINIGRSAHWLVASAASRLSGKRLEHRSVVPLRMPVSARRQRTCRAASR